MSLSKKGFTLIELLLVIGIIAILASIVIVAINPTRQLGNSRDAQRRTDVNTILNAVYQYAIDNNGVLPTTIPAQNTTTTWICAGTGTYNSTGGNCGRTTSGVNLDVLVASGRYLVKIPRDPQAANAGKCPGAGAEGTGTGTCYQIFKDVNGRVTVTAPGKEQSTTEIKVTR